MPAAIEISNVTKRYGQHTAVDGLSLDIRAGELFAFLGPNGAGKTTTIKMITGLLIPDGGEVRVRGHVMGRDGRQAMPTGFGFDRHGDADLDTFKVEVVDPGAGNDTVDVTVQALKPRYAADGSIETDDDDNEIRFFIPGDYELGGGAD